MAAIESEVEECDVGKAEDEEIGEKEAQKGRLATHLPAAQQRTQEEAAVAPHAVMLGPTLAGVGAGAAQLLLGQAQQEGQRQRQVEAANRAEGHTLAAGTAQRARLVGRH